ncbi:MAG: ATP-dependent DNA helicase RecG [Dehalococcoidia bacterium]|nr:ATP-dependent DNA helicase RecG [Dehalococcoidia bacterium]
MAGPVEGLRKILALEQKKKYSNTAIVGGLDAYLLRFAQESGLGVSHPFSQVLQALPPGGYRALHPVQRRRVVQELLRALEDGLPEPQEPPPAARPRLTIVPRSPEPPPPVRPPDKIVGTLDSPVSVLPAVTRTTEARLAKLGLRTVLDVLFHFPLRYHDYSEVRPIARMSVGEEQTVIGDVWSLSVGGISRYRKGTEAIIGDETGTMRVVWWGQTYVARRLRQGMRVALSGKVTAFRGRLQLENPEIEPLDDESLHTRRLVPVYPSTEGLFQRPLRGIVRAAVDNFTAKLEDALPEEMRGRLGLPAVQEALRQAHLPDSQEQADAARRRFAFEELLYIEIGVVRRRQEWQVAGGAPGLTLPPLVRAGFVESLPFTLTNAQRRAIDAVLADIGREVPMSRLLEGDVGSGKTVVAAAALLAAVISGYQGAIMAPTEILAEQHFRTFTRLLDPRAEDAGVDGLWVQEAGPGYVALQPGYLDRPVRVALLTGSLKASEKSAAQEAIARGEVDIAVGTHALVQEAVEFQRLGMAVVDEQHRFGVVQRAALREKGDSPHILVMTATPIPRTLALTVYGDLDITVLDEMPPGRPEVKTWRVNSQDRERAFKAVRRRIAEGRQAYVICPLVEESEAVAAKAAVQEYERLRQEVFPDLRLGLLHGRMTPGEKDATMRRFRDGELDILVSTAVVEVGIDVANATVMLIEGADRFGLAQLHQFRGRVRRSSQQAYCFLLSDNPSPEAQERLEIMERVNDGFELAEEDLRLRGPGEYFGTRQSGLPDLKVAKLTDVDLIVLARDEATRLLADDPELRSPAHAALQEQVKRLWGRIAAEVS